MVEFLYKKGYRNLSNIIIRNQLKAFIRFLMDKLSVWIKHPYRIWHVSHPDVDISIDIRQPLAIISFLGLLTWYIAYPSSPAFMVLVGLGLINAFSLAWALSMAQMVRGKRTLRSNVMQVGDELEEQIYLINKSIFPVLWAEFIDHSQLPGYTVTSVRAVESNNMINWRVHVICKQRGVFKLGPWELHLGDIFGFFHITQRYLQPLEILVYPPLTVLPSDILPRSGVVGDHRQLRQSLPIDTVNAYSTRAYQPGDPLRRFHWKITARQGSPFVRVFEPEAASKIWIIPDFDIHAHIGEGDQSTEEDMVLIAASISSQLLQSGLAVGLFACAGGEYIIPPGRSSVYLWRILRALAPLRAQQGCEYTKVMRLASKFIPPRDLMVLITPSTNLDWASEIKQFGHYSRFGVNVILLDPFSYGADQKAEMVSPVLSGMGFICRIIHKGEIQPLQETYGRLARWEFKTLGTGRVVISQSPRFQLDDASIPMLREGG